MTDNPNKTKWEDMAPEDRVAIYTAFEMGTGVVQFYFEQQERWADKSTYGFSNRAAFRIKPEDEEFSLSEQFTMPEGIPNFLVTLTVKNGRPSVVEVENIKTHMVFTPND